MKKLVTFGLLLCMILTLAACGKIEITMQGIYDAGQTEALLKNHESVYIREEMDGKICGEKYLTKDYIYDCTHDGEFDWAEFKTREIVALSGDYTYDDGTGYHLALTVSYDIDAPERVKEFLKYVNETEHLRNITVVSELGAEKEVSRSFQVPKGLVIGFRYEGEEYTFELYADAACTELYDPYANTDSDQTVYVKWTNA